MLTIPALLAAVAGLVLAAAALLYAGLRIGRGRSADLAAAPEASPAAARVLVGTWQGRQGYAFAASVSALSADVLIDGAEVLAPAGARLSVQSGDDESWTRPARRQAVRWRAAAGGKRDTVVQCRLHLPAAARAGAHARLQLTGALDEPGGPRISLPLTVNLRD